MADEQLLLFLRGVNLNPGAEPEDMVSVRIFAEAQRVISLRLRPLRASDEILQQLEEGKIRLIARGNDAPQMVNQTVRVHIVNADALKERGDVIKRFMDAYRETYEFLYTDPNGVKTFSEYSKVPEKLAVKIRDTFMPKSVMSPDKVSGLGAIMADAITFKTLAAPLTQAQLAELIQIPPRR